MINVLFNITDYNFINLYLSRITSCYRHHAINKVPRAEPNACRIPNIFQYYRYLRTIFQYKVNELTGHLPHEVNYGIVLNKVIIAKKLET